MKVVALLNVAKESRSRLYILSANSSGAKDGIVTEDGLIGIELTFACSWLRHRRQRISNIPVVKTFISFCS
jgi:hypothetical protein